MATTPNFGFELPTIGGDNNIWGADLNGNWSSIDAKLKATNDAITAIKSALHPVGSLYFTTVNTNPKTLLGFGTWVAYGAGRALVGVGTADGDTWSGGESKGSRNVTLTTAHLPAHTHGDNFAIGAGGGHTHAHTLGTNSTGAHTHDTNIYSVGSSISNANVAGRDVGNLSGEITTNSGGSHSHTVTGSITSVGTHTHAITGSVSSTGSGGAHTNVQPSIAIYVWNRTV